MKHLPGLNRLEFDNLAQLHNISNMCGLPSLFIKPVPDSCVKIT